MKVKPLREWSDDALWITWGIGLTLCVVIVAWLWLPPT
jgi:hypothetical protein